MLLCRGRYVFSRLFLCLSLTLFVFLYIAVCCMQPMKTPSGKQKKTWQRHVNDIFMIVLSLFDFINSWHAVHSWISYNIYDFYALIAYTCNFTSFCALFVAVDEAESSKEENAIGKRRQYNTITTPWTVVERFVIKPTYVRVQLPKILIRLHGCRKDGAKEKCKGTASANHSLSLDSQSVTSLS